MKRLSLCFALFFLVAPLSLFAGCSSQKENNVYRISAQFSENTLTSSMQFTFYNDEETALSFLCFNLYGNAYREGAQYPPLTASQASAYYNGKSYGDMEILSVSPCKGWEVCGEDENILRVDLEKELFPEESVTVNIEYVLTLAQVEHRTGAAKRSVNLGNFYPVLCAYEEGKGFYECVYSSNGDPFYSECADYEVTLTTDAGYVAASSGQAVSATRQGGKLVTEYELKNARDFALVLSEEYELYQTQAEGVQILYYAYEEENAGQMLELLSDCISYFSDTFGDFPYKTYSAVQTGFCFGGMEYPALVYLSDSLSREEYLYTAVHETAHQWWYAAVGNNECEHAFLDEGLAEYSSYLFFSEYKEYGTDAAALLKRAHSACNALVSVQEQVFGEADTTMDRPLSEYGGYEYVVIAYDKGMLLFDALRDAVGDSAFFSSLRRYYAQNKGKIATPASLAAAFKNAGASGVIASFVDGTAIV